MGRQTGTRVFCLHGQSPPSPLLGLPGEEGVRASLARKRARPWCRGDTGRRRRVNAFVLPRGEIWTLRKPKLVSKKLRRVFRAPDLGAMLQAQRELTHVQCYWGKKIRRVVKTVCSDPLSDVYGSNAGLTSQRPGRTLHSSILAPSPVHRKTFFPDASQVPSSKCHWINVPHGCCTC